MIPKEGIVKPPQIEVDTRSERMASGSLHDHESSGHECLKAYVCILYASPCAPLLILWPGEVEGTSLAIAQGKA